MAELWQLDAAALAEGYRSGAFTPVEALDACLARVAQCQPHLNAMAHVDRTGARQAAGASRLRWASGKPLGPLDGVPISLKDNLHAGGLPTGWGSQLLHGFVARKDELPVARLRAAGAVIFGKTTLPEFAMQGYTGNLATGITRNPWNTALTPGGSSGGAAASVAAGCGPLALATDGGGSIRRPASHCGVVGFKPSAGLVPREGGLPEIFLDYETAGAIGRTVGDVQHVMQVLAGPSPGLAVVPAAPARILFAPRFATHPVDAGIAAQVAGVARRFEALGHGVEEAQAFDLSEPLNALWSTLSCAGLAWMMGEADHFPEFGLEAGQVPDITQCTQAVQDNLRDGLAGEAAALFELLACVQALNRRLQAVFANHDFILTPAAAALPWAADQPHPVAIAGQVVGPRGHAVYTAFANAAGLPAIALPAGMLRGLPAGFQLVGRPGADAQVLAMALQYEQAHPWAGTWPELPP
ncbi:MAG: amidase [Burkholderiales bacterium]|nr:amidase [Burkholderiales bacterium]